MNENTMNVNEAVEAAVNEAAKSGNSKVATIAVAVFTVIGVATTVVAGFKGGKKAVAWGKAKVAAKKAASDEADYSDTEE